MATYQALLYKKSNLSLSSLTSSKDFQIGSPIAEISGVWKNTLALNNPVHGAKDGEQFRTIMSSISCLMTIAIVDGTDDISRLIDFVRGLRSEGNRVAKTQLFVMVPYLDDGLLQNKTINFNVMIMKNGAGRVDNSIFYK